MICSNKDKTVFKVTSSNNIFTKFFTLTGEELIVTKELEEAAYFEVEGSLPKKVIEAIDHFKLEVEKAMKWLESGIDTDLFLYILENKNKLSEEERLLLLDQC